MKMFLILTILLSSIQSYANAQKRELSNPCSMLECRNARAEELIQDIYFIADQIYELKLAFQRNPNMSIQDSQYLIRQARSLSQQATLMRFSFSRNLNIVSSAESTTVSRRYAGHLWSAFSEVKANEQMLSNQIRFARTKSNRVFDMSVERSIAQN